MVEQIAELLGPLDLSRLRSTCRILCAKTIHKFGQICLGTIRTDLSSTSLRRLYQLSQKSQFNHYVHGLRISAAPGTHLGDGFTWTRGTRTGQIAVPHLQPGVRIFRHALHYLPNCTTFIICLEHHDNNFNTFHGNYLGPSDAITIILDSVAYTDLRVTSFHVDFRTNRPRGAFQMDGTRLFTECLFFDAFVRRWTKVHTLQLHHTVESRRVTEWAVEMIRQSQGLEKLDIDFELGSKAAIMIREISKSGPLAAIRELRLSSPSSLKGADLLALLSRFSGSLRTLYLHHVFIKGVSWREIIAALKAQFLGLTHVNFFRLGCPSFPIVPFPSLAQDLSVKGPHADRFVYRANERDWLIGPSILSMQAALQALLDNTEFF